MSSTIGPPDPGNAQHDTQDVARSDLPFPVVGLGAAAGGIDALNRFFSAMPTDSGIAFVVVLHLSARHESHREELLGRVTAMPVLRAVDRMPLRIDHVYVVSPSMQVTMSDGHLCVGPVDEVDGRDVAIDVFMRTLADAHGEHSMAAVLSGNGADGAVGIARIRERGGLTFAQSPDDAQQPGMPRSAILTGSIDFVLPVAEMAQKIHEFARTAMRRNAATLNASSSISSGRSRNGADERALHDILGLVRLRTRHDFHHYKRGTILRRLQRRLQIHALPDLASYLEYLRHHSDETPLLLQDLLVSVTSFFRDRTAFALLETEALPAMLERREPAESIRAWVIGCATGEEAYSISMLLLERLDDGVDPRPTIQVFATDIDEQAIAIARAGLYPAAIAADVAPSRLRRFFTKDGDRYRVTKQLRETVLFAAHNVLRDPPFSQIDLLCCRNVLIYLERTGQASVGDIFRFALKPGGLLFLGTSESVEGQSARFVPLDKQQGIFRAVGQAPRPLVSDGTLRQRDASGHVLLPAVSDSALLHRQAIEQSAEPSVLVDDELRTLHISPGAGRYLTHRAGAPSTQLLDNVLPPLRAPLRATLHKAVETRAAIERRGVRFMHDGVLAQLSIKVFVVRNGADAPPQYLITFADLERVTEFDASTVEVENRRLMEQLQESVEAGETSAEELKASNEELQAMNEELRSAGEELETSKEELQSMNEELSTVNAELRTRIDELAMANDDLRNLMASSDIATVFVDRIMRIKRFTPRAAEIFHVIPTDIGRPLTHINHRLEYPELSQDVALAFDALQTSERRVRSHDGRYFLARVLPYRTADDRIEGAVITCVDVSALHRAEERARSSEEHLRLAVESTYDYAIFTCDEAGFVTTWNAGAERVFGYSDLEMIGKSASLLFTVDDRARGAPQHELEQARTNGRAEDERWHLRKDGSLVRLSGVMIPLMRDGLQGYSKIARDVTLAIEAEEGREAMLAAEQATRARFEADNRLKDELLAVMSHELKHPLNLILVHLDLLMQVASDVLDARAARAAEIIRGAVVGQGKIIDDLLDLSRVRTGKMALELEPVDLGPAIEAIIQSTAREATEKDIEVRVSADRSLRPVLADPVRVDQIVWNLVSNALKFTGEGGCVRIELAADGDDALLTVTDNGKGIASAFLPHVFDMFSQEGRGPSRERGGLGIGLALVREIVTGLDGRVAASSDGLGKGATFRVWLPFAPRAEPKDVVPPTPPAHPTLAGLRVLMVDDSGESLAAFVELLRINGALPVGASGGHMALRIAEMQTFDVVISDLAMPGLDGYALMRELRRRERTKDVLAIALTGYGRERDKVAAQEAGFDTHVGKPASVGDILRVLDELQWRRRGDRGD